LIFPTRGITAPASFSFHPTRMKRKECEQVFGKICAEEGQHIVGWRDVPRNNGPLAKRRGRPSRHAAGFHPAQSEAHLRDGV